LGTLSSARRTSLIDMASSCMLTITLILSSVCYQALYRIAGSTHTLGYIWALSVVPLFPITLGGQIECRYFGHTHKHTFSINTDHGKFFHSLSPWDFLDCVLFHLRFAAMVIQVKHTWQGLYAMLEFLPRQKPALISLITWSNSRNLALKRICLAHPFPQPKFHLEELRLSSRLGLGMGRYVGFGGNGTD